MAFSSGLEDHDRIQPPQVHEPSISIAVSAHGEETEGFDDQQERLQGHEAVRREQRRKPSCAGEDCQRGWWIDGRDVGVIDPTPVLVEQVARQLLGQGGACGRYPKWEHRIGPPHDPSFEDVTEHVVREDGIHRKEREPRDRAEEHRSCQGARRTTPSKRRKRRQSRRGHGGQEDEKGSFRIGERCKDRERSGPREEGHHLHAASPQSRRLADRRFDSLVGRCQLPETTAMQAASIPFLILAGVSTSALGAEVRGVLEVKAVPIDQTRVQAASHSQVTLEVAEPAPGYRSEIPPVALFLSVKDSLPIESAPPTPEVRVAGYRFEPPVVACAVDGQVLFINESDRAVTLTAGSALLGVVAPDENLTYACEAGPSGAGSRTISVKEHPFMLATVYVGEVGVAALPGPDGAFRLVAPNGRYELRVVGAEGLLMSQAVTVADRDVELGVVQVESSGGR
ncbi:MAG: hypothetical protein HC923_13685 [Myxococcales bacterium]|nr:hypothetical protein [Myxococcales bacterium]